MDKKEITRRELTYKERFSGYVELESLEAESKTELTAEMKDFQEEVVKANIESEKSISELKEELKASSEKFTALEAKFSAVEEALAQAKLIKSNPAIPKAEFREEEIQKSYTSQDLTAAIDAALIADRKKIIENRSKF